MTFQVEWTSEAWTEARALPVRDRRSLMNAVGALARLAEVATQGRRPLDGRLGEAPHPIWAARLRGGHRLLYSLTGPAPDDGRRRAWILRALIAGPVGDPVGDPVGSPVGRLVVTPGQARELERRRRTLRKLGGGIPHEVVHRAWLAEQARDRP